jgi:hypothetical protein
MAKKKKISEAAAAKGEEDNWDFLDDFNGDVYSKMKVLPVDGDRFKPGGDDNLTQKVNSNQSHFSFFITHETGDVVGRRAIANQELAAGSTLLKERAFPWVVRLECEREVCHTCAASLETVESVLQCSECSHAFYCSSKCQAEAQHVHDMECTFLAVMQTLETRVDFNLLRIALAFLVARRQARQPSIFSTDFQPEERDVNAMVAHAECMSAEDRADCQAAVSHLLSTLPLEFHLPVEDVMDFLNRVNSNAHGLAHESREAEFGLGLFPLCAIFNHSCYPNVVFTNEGSKLVFRVIACASFSMRRSFFIW